MVIEENVKKFYLLQNY